MANANPLEKVIEQRVCDHAKKLGCLVYKFTSPSRRSVPDRLFIMPDGKGVFFIEFKRKGQKPTPAQVVEIEKIRKQGTRVYVIDDATSGRCLLADIMHGVALMPMPNGMPGYHIVQLAKAPSEMNRKASANIDDY